MIKHAIFFSLCLVVARPLGAKAESDATARFGDHTVEQEIRRNIGSVRRCYESEVRIRPRLSGKIIVSLTVAPGGLVTETVATHNSTGSQTLANCLTRSIRRLELGSGPRNRSATFRYPFVFHPQN